MLGQKRSLLSAWGVVLALGAGCGEKFSEGTQPNGGAGSSSGGSDSTSAGKATDGGKSSAGAGMNGGSGGRAGSSSGGGTAPNNGGKGGTEITVGGSLPIAAMGGEGGEGDVPVVVVPNIPTDGLELWFDASRGVGQVSGIVSTWADQSGHHRDALQTANNLRPRLVADALAGKPAIVFDGAVDGDYLKLPTLDVDFANGISIFVAAQQTTEPDATACEGFFEASNGSEIDDIHLGTYQKSLIFEVYANWINDTNFPLVFDKPELLAAILPPSQQAELRRNSNGVGSGSIPLPVKIARTEVFLGRTLYKECAPLQGALGEVIVYSRAVNDQELIQIESYLQKRWGCCTE